MQKKFSYIEYIHYIYSNKIKEKHHRKRIKKISKKVKINFQMSIIYIIFTVNKNK